MMTNTLAERLISRRKKLGLTQDQLAKPAKMTRVTVSNIELGNSTNIRAESLFAIAKVLKCNPEWLLSGKGPEELDSSPQLSGDNFTPGPEVEQKCPIINWVQAGSWTQIDEPFDNVEYLPAPVKCSPGTFILRIKGDSMEPRFEEGDLIYVDPAKVDPEHSKYVVAMLEDSHEATFKQLQLIDGKKYLKALNPDYPPEMKFIKINGNCRIVGTVVSHVKPI
ncbi:LexA family transcriptional regulator [Photobacterium sp. OFAV2-7]|uniref:LexA family protein n=1 Tax=Photobacterium sp. OFAV2-7 TaxID=2917748 RepID=UPI001EF637B6|nr:S24 family peptidase [Photobacterium sp. OFAV2-7]MCG7588721.1 helix-turn-helix domain-containing protein [Photobacterium sp. OFAV2-7]